MPLGNNVPTCARTPVSPGNYAKWLLWILAGLFTLGALANIASRSKVERLLWRPVALVIAVSIAIVAMGL